MKVKIVIPACHNGYCHPDCPFNRNDATRMNACALDASDGNWWSIMKPTERCPGPGEYERKVEPRVYSQAEIAEMEMERMGDA